MIWPQGIFQSHAHQFYSLSTFFTADTMIGARTGESRRHHHFYHWTQSAEKETVT